MSKGGGRDHLPPGLMEAAKEVVAVLAVQYLCHYAELQPYLSSVILVCK